MRGFKSPSLRHQPVGIPTGFHFIEKVILRTVENDLDPDRLAYTADNLYDIINDKIGKLQREHPEPEPYEHSTEIIR